MNILSLEHLTHSYTERKLFDDADFYLHEGDKVGVIGINGTGKSTLLKIMAGLETPDEGQVIQASNLMIHYLPQNPEFSEEDTVLQSVQNMVHHHANENELIAAKAMLTRLGITDFEQKTRELSGGQRKRLALVSVLITPCDVLILDEPTNHLDSEMADWLENKLQAFRGALVMVTHDRYFLDLVCNRIVELDKGKLYYVLAPLNKKESRIYYPVDREKDGRARRTITRAEAEQVLNEIPRIALIEVVNDKMREDIYKQTLYSGDCRNWAALIKTLFLRRQDRLRQGKRIASVDERYMKMAEEALYSEMAFARGKSKEEMKHFIIDYIENRQERVCG